MTAATTTAPEITGLPDMKVSVRQLFGIDSDMEVPAYSEPDEHVPETDPDYRFDRPTTLAVLAGFAASLTSGPAVSFAIAAATLLLALGAEIAAGVYWLGHRFERFESREHAVHPVEAAAARLRVHVAAGHHRFCIRVAAGAPDKNIADAVDTDRVIARPGPREQQLARGDIFAGKRWAIDAVAGNRADLSHVGVAAPQAFFVDGAGGVAGVFSHVSRALLPSP